MNMGLGNGPLRWLFWYQIIRQENKSSWIIAMHRIIFWRPSKLSNKKNFPIVIICFCHSTVSSPHSLTTQTLSLSSVHLWDSTMTAISNSLILTKNPQLQLSSGNSYSLMISSAFDLVIDFRCSLLILPICYFSSFCFLLASIRV